MIRTQSFRKNSTSASAVATCIATSTARYGESLPMLRSRCHAPPSQAGSRMLWPRLDTGNNSDTPCKAPTTIAST